MKEMIVYHIRELIAFKCVTLTPQRMREDDHRNHWTIKWGFHGFRQIDLECQRHNISTTELGEGGKGKKP